MNKDDKASISLKRLISVSIILLFVMGIAVFAVNNNITNVKIILSNGYEMTVMTSSTKVSEILEENHIVLLPNEVVTPGLDQNISDNKTIRISESNEPVQVVSETIEKSSDVTVEGLLAENYDSIVEKIVTERITIDYQTITKDVSTGTNTKEVVVKKGVNGCKEVTYKITYRNDVELQRIQISENIIKEPVDKIVEIRTATVTSRASDNRALATTSSSISGSELASRVTGMTPVVKTLNASAYTASTCGKSASSAGYGITSAGVKAAAWCTVAAGSGYPIGTIIYIPYFADMPNGGWFIVQDRGGAISNSKIDIYMDSYNECISFGRRNLECYIYQF